MFYSEQQGNKLNKSEKCLHYATIPREDNIVSSSGIFYTVRQYSKKEILQVDYREMLNL